MMLQGLIKKHTAGLHNELEKIMFVEKIMDGSLTFEEYKFLLQTNYVLHRRYENFLLTGLSQEISNQLRIHQRQKLPALEKDILQARCSIPEINDEFMPGPHLENNDAARLGALYVFEGAMLGGHIIVKYLRSNSHLLTQQLDFFYYNLYDDKLREYWKNFCTVLNCQEASASASAIAGAQVIFKDFIKTAKQIKSHRGFQYIY